MTAKVFNCLCKSLGTRSMRRTPAEITFVMRVQVPLAKETGLGTRPPSASAMVV